MSENEPRRRTNLGRGLSALLGDDNEEELSVLDEVRATRSVPIEFLSPSPYQPRTRFSEDQLNDLVDSIGRRGILQPLLVRRHPEDANRFEIVAGERRWRAAQLAQLHEVPVIVKDLDNQQVLEVALIENLQRQDLTPLEEAEGFRRLMDEFNHTQEGLAEALGKSRSHIANTLRLLNLPDEIKALVNDNKLSAGHARALLTANDPIALAETVIKRGLNVRQAEQLAKKGAAPKSYRKQNKEDPKDADTLSLERDLSALLGLRVAIRFRGHGGDLTVHFDTVEQLDDILQRLSGDAGGLADADADFGDIAVDMTAIEAVVGPLDAEIAADRATPANPGTRKPPDPETPDSETAKPDEAEFAGADPTEPGGIDALDAMMEGLDEADAAAIAEEDDDTPATNGSDASFAIEELPDSETDGAAGDPATEIEDELAQLLDRDESAATDHDDADTPSATPSRRRDTSG